MTHNEIIHLAGDDEPDKVIIHMDDAPGSRIGPSTFRKRVLRYGSWNHGAAPGGVLNVDPKMCDQLVANFNDSVMDHVFVPYGHPKDEAAAVRDNVGEVLALEHVADDGVWATINVAADAAPKIGKTVKGVSCGLLPSYKDHEVGGRGDVGPVLAHVALTNEPYIKGLGDFEPVTLAQSSDGVLLEESTQPATPPKEGSETMTLEELLAELKKDHGIDVAALQTTATSHDELTAFLDAHKDDDKDTPDPAAVAAEAEGELVAALAEALVGAKVITLSEGQDTPTKAQLVSAIVQTAEQGQAATVALAEAQADAAVKAAVEAGNILPAKADTFKALFLSDRETFDALTDTKVIDLAEHGSAGAEDEPTESDTTEIDRLSELAGGL